MFKKKYIAIILSLYLFFSFLPVSFAWDGLIRPFCLNYANEGCTLCDGIGMVKGIIDFAMSVSVSIAMLSVLVGGVLYIFAGAYPSTVNWAKKILKDAIIGMALIFGAWLIINIILTGIGFTTFATSQGLINPNGWFVITCR